jgi:hypothetical protein
VHISSVNLHTEGIYRCEVSNEFPVFDTVSRSVKLNVVGKEKSRKIVLIVNFFNSAIPSGPFITPSPPVLVSAGDQIDLNCSSFGSLPRPNLNWYINKTPVPLIARRIFNYQENVFSIIHLHKQKDGTLDSVLQLKFRIRESQFQVIA